MIASEDLALMIYEAKLIAWVQSLTYSGPITRNPSC